ncbi:MAG: DsbA family protein [Rhizobium sp.]|nr:DsbA family protein [Rhizobium sp.]
MNKRLLVILAALAAVGVFAAGSVLYTPPQKEQATAPVEETSLVRKHSPVIGKVDAPVTIVEFLDPSCEACRAFFPIVKDVLAQYPDDVRLVVRYAAFHPGSDEAVRIIEASRRQDKFEQVLAALFENQDRWAAHGSPDLKQAWEIARGAGVELMQARLDGVKPEVDAILKQDAADVATNKVEQTPTFFVNGAPLTEFSEEGFKALVKRQVDAVRSGS